MGHDVSFGLSLFLISMKNKALSFKRSMRKSDYMTFIDSNETGNGVTCSQGPQTWTSCMRTVVSVDRVPIQPGELSHTPQYMIFFINRHSFTMCLMKLKVSCKGPLQQHFHLSGWYIELLKLANMITVLGDSRFELEISSS